MEIINEPTEYLKQEEPKQRTEQRLRERTAPSRKSALYMHLASKKKEEGQKYAITNPRNRRYLWCNRDFRVIQVIREGVKEVGKPDVAVTAWRECETVILGGSAGKCLEAQKHLDKRVKERLDYSLSSYTTFFCPSRCTTKMSLPVVKWYPLEPRSRQKATAKVEKISKKMEDAVVNKFKPKNPYIGMCFLNTKIIGDDAPGETWHMVFSTEGTTVFSLLCFLGFDFLFYYLGNNFNMELIRRETLVLGKQEKE
ncbi:hypothetical protein LguiB_006084 [Lonicera macranthoides]